MSESLPDILAKALLEGADCPLSRRTVEEDLVPVVMAALTVEPDGHERVGDVELPFWRSTYVFGGRLVVWPGGRLEIEHSPVGNLTPVQVEQVARVLLSVAAEMRKHSAWTEEKT